MRALLLWCALLLCCMDTRTASLGAVAASDRPADVTPADAGEPAALDAGSPGQDAGKKHDDEGDDEEHDEHATLPAATSAGASLDGGATSPTSPTVAKDARVDDDEHELGFDAALPVNPLCVTEPWHCP